MSQSPEEIQQQQQEAEHRRELLALGIVFAWDSVRLRYVDLRTDETLSPATVRGYVDAALQTSARRIERLTKQLISGDITLPEWRTVVQRELKAANTGLAELAIGGRSEWNATQAGRLGQRLRFLYDRLNNLELEWEQGLVSPEQLLNRIGMAVEYGRGTYEAMVRGMMMDAGLQEEMRTLGPTAHCTDCPPISGYWAEIGSLPGIGDSACLSNCACSFEYR